jgi:hypothetical protein
MSDYNSPGLILDQSQLQSNGLNIFSSNYMSTGVGGGVSKKGKSHKKSFKKGGDCGCNHAQQQQQQIFSTKGGKKSKTSKKSKKSRKNKKMKSSW